MNKTEELYKEVEKVSLSDLMPKHNFPPGFECAIVDENKNILNFCSKKYNLVPNKSLFVPIEKTLESIGIDFSKRVNIINGSKFYVDYILKEKNQSKKVGDVFPKISVVNSYDGTIKFRKEFGYYKLVCENGLTTPTGIHSKRIAKHYKGSENEIDELNDFISEFPNAVDLFIKSLSYDYKLFEELQGKKADVKQVEEFAKMLNLSKGVTKAAIERFELETKGNFGYRDLDNNLLVHDGGSENLFTVYNCINHAIYNTNVKELPEKKLEKDKSLISLFEKAVN
jgi:hypothetical protein